MVRRKSHTRPVLNRSSNQQTTYLNKRQRNVTLAADKSKQVKKRKNHILRDIKLLQKSTKLLIPKASFTRLVREIIIDLFPRANYLRIQSTALEALQESAEMYLVQFFEDSFLLSLHTNRVTLMQRDMILLRRLRGRGDIINR